MLSISMFRRNYLKISGPVILGFLAAVVAAFLMASGSTAAHAAVWTDQADYSPGSVVTISGDNSDGAGYQPGEAVDVAVNGPDTITKSCSATADSSGAWSCQITLGTGSAAVGTYVYTATGESSNVSQSGTFTDSACPATAGTRPTDPNVTASYTTGGGTASYSIGTSNESSSGGIPGLIEYCVYTSPLPDSQTALYSDWTSGASTHFFDFERSGGDPDNLPFDGSTKTVGYATWGGSVPSSQLILLHINDPSECANLYGAGSSATCFVLPGTPRANKDLQVTKTATPSFTRTYKWGITKSVDQTQINIADGGSATFNYTVNVTHDSGTAGNWKVIGEIQVTNPNAVDFNGVNVTDAIDNNGTCSVDNGTNAAIPAGQSVSFAYTCTYTAAPSPASGTNTAKAKWDASTYNTPDGAATGTASYDFSGDSPTIVDGSVTVTDPLGGGTLGTVKYTDPSPTSFNYSHTFSGDPASTCTKHDNTATFTTDTSGTSGSDSKTVEVCMGADLQVSKTATPSFIRTFTWGIQKLVDKTEIDIAGGSATFNYTVNVTHDSGTDSAWQVDGKITVTNPNDWEAISADVTDAIGNGGNCAVTDGTGVSIPAGKSVDLSYTCTYASAPDPLTGATNTATATWVKSASFTPNGSATGTAAVDFTTPTTIADDSVAVTDSLGGSLGTVSYTDPSPKTFTYSKTFAKDPAGTCTTHGNTAMFTADTTGATGSDSKTVKVCVGADLTVSKTATPSFTRKYNWTINKSVDKTLLDPGGTATYAVKVTETDFTDSGWKVSGTITVYNPNDWEPITANVTDAIDNGGNCAVSNGAGVTIMPFSSAQLSYTCTYSSAPSQASGTNTATAAWDAAKYSTPDASAAGQAGAAFSSPTTVTNQMITVVDSQAGTLGTVTATDSPPYTKTFTYMKTFSSPASGCTTVNNTATITETGQTAKRSVKVCNSGALTMGFWQNKNGQPIIANGASTSGVCNSATWLRQYAPFGDLSATATCSQAATYVYNLIKAANASGASMNAMLKAQMLATSLDVYFSDPGLGGNKISAPAPIGGLTIDLTHICHMIDSSSGTATCSGTYANVSGAFGGATSLTVSQMLSFAASQSNSGGSTWYSNVKATQQLAKDTFDAINNQVATSP